MDLNLTGTRVLITGASSGIGYATAELFHSEGARVVGVSRRAPETPLPGVHHVLADLGTPDAPGQVVAQALEHLGGLDVVVNNAALGTLSGGVATETDEQWAQVFDVNLNAVFRLLRAALPTSRRAAG